RGPAPVHVARELARAALESLRVVQARLMVQQPLLARPVGVELHLELSVEPQQELLGVDGIGPHAVRTRPQRIAHLLPGRRAGRGTGSGAEPGAGRWCMGSPLGRTRAPGRSGAIA